MPRLSDGLFRQVKEVYSECQGCSGEPIFGFDIVNDDREAQMESGLGISRLDAGPRCRTASYRMPDQQMVVTALDTQASLVVLY